MIVSPALKLNTAPDSAKALKSRSSLIWGILFFKSSFYEYKLKGVILENSSKT